MKPQQLPAGQINPAASSVNAFLNPVEYQVQRPSQPQGLPNVKTTSTVQTAGVGSVQGRNSATDLANALGRFTPKFAEAASSAALQYASWQMDEGEKKAVEAAQRAAANNDQMLQAAEQERAAGNRQVATKDPQAGLEMHQLNPFQKMGFQRGISKALGEKIKSELPLLAAGMDPGVYLDADMGASALEKRKAERLDELFSQYGYTKNDPGFQTNVLPAINKGSDAAYKQLAKDRTAWFDANAPRIQANAIGQLIQTSNQTGTVEIDYGGQSYTFNRAEDPVAFSKALSYKAAQLNNEFGLRAGLPGQRSKWDAETYKILIAQADFRNNSQLRRTLDNIPSTIPMRGPDGKVKKYPNGDVIMLPMGEAYGQESIDSEIKYGKAAYEQQNRRYTQLERGAYATVSEATSSVEPGFEANSLGSQALERFIEVNEVPRIEAERLRRELPQMLNESAGVYGLSYDPGVGLNWRTDFDERNANGGLGTEAQELKELRAAAMQIPQERREQFYEEGRRKIESAFKGRSVVDKFPSITEALKDRVEENLAKYYRKNQRTEGDRKASEFRQTLAFRKHIEKRLAAALDEKRQKAGDSSVQLTEGEALEVAAQAMNEYGQNDEAQLEYLFPGSAYFPDSPSVSPRAQPEPQAQAPVSEQTTAPSSAQPQATPPVTLEALSRVPDQRVRLFQSEAIIAAPDLAQVVIDQINAAEKGEQLPLPSPILKAARTAGVKPWQFIEAQMRFYPYFQNPDWTPQQLEAAKSKMMSSAALESNALATVVLEQRGLSRLARLNDWMA